MTDPLITDVKDLLEREKGDEVILKQILRACQNNEVISNYERNYVKKLAEKYLAKIPPIEEQPSEKVVMPDVISPQTSTNQKIETIQTYKQTSKTGSKNNKLLLGIGGAIIIGIIVGVFLVGNFNTQDDLQTNPTESTIFSIQTDLSTYQKGDIISINGRSNTLGTLNLSIENQQNQLVWSEQITVKNDGRFSTLAIAGGNGWEKSGTYTIKAESDLETISKTFSFSG